MPIQPPSRAAHGGRASSVRRVHAAARRGGVRQQEGRGGVCVCVCVWRRVEASGCAACGRVPGSKGKRLLTAWRPAVGGALRRRWRPSLRLQLRLPIYRGLLGSGAVGQGRRRRSDVMRGEGGGGGSCCAALPRSPLSTRALSPSIRPPICSPALNARPPSAVRPSAVAAEARGVAAHAVRHRRHRFDVGHPQAQQPRTPALVSEDSGMRGRATAGQQGPRARALPEGCLISAQQTECTAHLCTHRPAPATLGVAVRKRPRRGRISPEAKAGTRGAQARVPGQMRAMDCARQPNRGGHGRRGNGCGKPPTPCLDLLRRRHGSLDAAPLYKVTQGPGQGCIGREGTLEAAAGAVRQAVGGGCQSSWGRLLSVTNAVEAGTWGQGDSGWA